MPKLILRCNYLKNAPPSHLANYMNYISTREGVEFIDDSTGLLPATAGQKRLIGELIQTIEGTKRMYEYQDYLQKPTRANASEFITQVLENNLDILAKKKNYIDYLANRPRVEKIGTHGLFSNEGESVVLSRVADEVANHTGVIWTNVISLRREDAERLGYDSAAQWQVLLRSRVQLLCECYKIDSRNLRWYAAFHNESHHPHVHMVIYSTDPSEGHLTKQGIETMRSTYAHDIFRQEFMSIYEKKTKQRDQLKEQANKSLLFLLQQMQTGICHDLVIAEQMQLLSKRLMNTRGKKVYGYLKADVKAIVNSIVDELAKEEKVAECYRRWQETQNEIIGYYRDTVPAQLPLSEQKELKSIKNMVIREAVRFGQGAFYAEDEDMNEDEGFNVEGEDLDAEEMEQEQRDIPDGYEDDQAGGTSDDTSGPSPLSPPEAYAEWTDRYKEARGYLYGTPDSPPDAEAAYEIMKEEAESGNAYAMHDMGKIYSQGIFTEKDQQAAQVWYQKALSAMLHVEGKKAQAYLEYRIGKMYQYGLGTDEDLIEAARWFSMAAGKENKHALYSLGMLYLQGRGVEQDDVQAFRLFARSHQKGNPYASYELGKLYETGRGTEQDGEMADNCYRVAFLGFLKMEKESRDDNLWYRIGCMYMRGIGTEQDVATGEKYLKKASEYGNTHADYMLGKLYAEGTLAAKDMEKALYHLHRAAQAGNTSARYRLGRIYLEDEYKDILQAVQFLTLAAEQGNDLAAYRLGKLYGPYDGMHQGSYLYCGRCPGRPNGGGNQRTGHRQQPSRRQLCTGKGDENNMQPVVMLLIAGVVMFSVIGGLSLLAHYYTLNGIKSRTVGDGQHGTARFATKKEVEETYLQVAYEPEHWRKGEHLPTAQGLVLGSIERAGKLYALVDTGDVHCLMIGAAGVGKTAHFLYPNIEYACACGMSFLTTDTKGDLYRNYAGIARKYYGYQTAVIDLRNPTRSDGDNMLHLVNKYMDQYLADNDNLSAKAKAEKYAKITAKAIISSGGADSASYGQNAFFYDAAEGLLTAAILLIAEFCPKEKRHIISVFKLIQDLLAPSKIKGKNQFQLLMAKLPDTHKTKWFAGAALNTAEQSMQSVLSTALSRLNAFLDSELEQILCFDTAIDAELFCKQKTAIFLVMPEEDNTKYFIISLIIQQLYREILMVADENGGKLDNRVVFYWDEVGTIPKIESAEMMFSASRSRKVSIVPMIQSFAQLNKNYGKEGAEIIIDNCQDTIFGGFAPNSESAEVLSKALGNKTVMSGSISRGKNDPSQSLQMIQRPLLTPDELKSLPKGTFIVSKTGAHPMQTKLKLFLKWGITFEEPYEIEEKSARKVAYADKQEIEAEIIRRYMCCMGEETEHAEQGASGRGGGMLQSQTDEPVSRSRQSLRTED